MTRPASWECAGRAATPPAASRRPAWRRAASVVAASLLAALLSACPGAQPGDRCRSHDECAGLADGYCARAEVCTRECVPGGTAPKEACPKASACVPGVRRATCLALCLADADCAPGHVCRDLPEGRVCVLLDPLAAPPK